MTDYIQQERESVVAMTDQAETRAKFIVKTYTHLFGAIVLFTLIEIFFFTSGIAYPIARTFLSTNWLVVLGGFVIVSWIASRTAHRAESTATQYIGLLLFVLAEALIFVPLLVIADYYAPGMIKSAALVTLFGFTGLTFIAVWTRKNFSFLGGLLRWGMILALVAIVGGVIFGFQLGTWFSVAMIGLAGAAILYDTSRILTEFPTDRHVGAALQLFSSVALMFWYVLRLFLSRR
jgi:FtsH-binding integral membrane protein